MAATHARVYLARSEFDDPPPPFRTGAAGLVRLDAEGAFELEERMQISANSLHAMVGHGVVDRLNALGLEGTLGGGAPVLVRPALVEEARSILYDADRKTYGAEYEFVVAEASGEAPTEYRVAVENREYQVTLVRLVDVFQRAGRHGEAVWITI
ncbi:MAG: hypothetical protein AAGC67_19945 [Myxococcota bacterium]